MQNSELKNIRFNNQQLFIKKVKIIAVCIVIFTFFINFAPCLERIFVPNLIQGIIFTAFGTTFTAFGITVTARKISRTFIYL